MLRRIAIYAFIFVTVVGGIATAADALVLTDEERLEAFTETLDGDVTDQRIDQALDFADPDREPVELIVGRFRALYDEGQGAELAERAHSELAPLAGSGTTLLQRSIHIDGDEALVAVRVRTRGGVIDASFNLTRHGDGWLIRRVRIQS
jgi:hypothetical protein